MSRARPKVRECVIGARKYQSSYNIDTLINNEEDNRENKVRSYLHTEMSINYHVFCLKKKNTHTHSDLKIRRIYVKQEMIILGCLARARAAVVKNDKAGFSQRYLQSCART